MSEPTREQELKILAARMPNFAEILVKEARAGRMTGYEPMTEIISPAGTIYTHLARGNVLRGVDLAHEVRKALGQSEWLPTSLEKLLLTVRPGDKPHTSEPLKLFVDLLRPHLLYPESAKIQATQERLW
jgi:hypothetical protein